ncbi:MAG: hypothetical protein NTY75_04260, partial [Candidatus Shapirobacteria bacterium]|nr:hypothetical protein [Candidatus Shapirobacteria bacterium]
QTARRKANDVARKGDLSALSKALILYYTDLNKFPPTLDLTTGGQLMDGTYVYMKVMPKEKNTSLAPFCYKVDDIAKPKKFALMAQLENTADSDCKNPPLPGCGHTYCYVITSPNTSLDVHGVFQ